MTQYGEMSSKVRVTFDVVLPNPQRRRGRGGHGGAIGKGEEVGAPRMVVSTGLVWSSKKGIIRGQTWSSVLRLGQ